MIQTVRTLLLCTALITVPARADQPADDLEANKALVRTQYEEILSQGRFDLLDEVVAEDFIQHDEGSGRADTRQPELSGREVTRAHFTKLREGIPDYRLEIRKIVAEGDIVSVFAVASGTHTGPLFGIPPTGKPFTFATFDMFRIEDGKLAEHWDAVDRLGVMRRLGLIPLEGGE